MFFPLGLSIFGVAAWFPFNKGQSNLNDSFIGNCRPYKIWIVYYLLVRHWLCIAKVQNSYGFVQNVQAGEAGTNLTSRPQLWYKDQLRLEIVQSLNLEVTFVPAKPGLNILYKNVGFFLLRAVTNQKTTFSG